MKDDDDDIQEYVPASGWRKRQYDPDAIYEREMRNRTLEEVAKEFDSMKAFGDTSASFAVFVRGMKR
jgi:hypothetical protein